MFLSDSLFPNSSIIQNNYSISFCRFFLAFSEGFSILFPDKEECMAIFQQDPKNFKDKQEIFLNLIHPEFLSSFIFTLNKAKALQTSWEWTGKFNIEQKVQTLLFKAKPHIQDNVATWEGMIVDISHLDIQTNSSSNIINSQKKQFGELSQTGTWSMKLDPFHLVWDEQAKKIHNLANVSLEGIHHVFEIYPREYRAILRRAIKSVILTKETFDLEIPYSSPDSKWKWVRISGKPLQSVGSVTEIIGIVQDVTRLKELEEKNRQNERKLTDNHFMNNGSWVADLRNGNNIWSTEALKLFGFDPEIQGPTITDYEKRIHSEDLRLYKEAIIRGFKEKKTIGVNFRIVLPDRTIKNISTVSKAIFGENGRAIKICGYLKEGNYDPQEIVQAENHADEFQSFVKSCPIALAILDKNLNFIKISDRWIEEYELQSTQTIGRNLCEVSASIHERLAPLFKKALIHEKVVQEQNEEFMLINERWEWVRWEVQSWYDHKDSIGGYILKTEFTTQRKQSEADLFRAKEAAEKAALAKSQFLYSISHEIRTPLNAVIGFTNLLLQETPMPYQEEYLNILKFSSENLSALMNDILDFSKIESEKIKLAETEFNPRDLLSIIRSSFAPKAAEKNLSFRIMMDDDIPKTLIGDSQRLKQILDNLIGNAIKFTEKGKVIINLTLAYKDVEQSTLLFEILDTGFGIESNILQNIFEGFTKGTSNQNINYGGTGLGLAITKKLAELFGGEVWVESELGKGSTFFLKIKFKNTLQVIPIQESTPLNVSILKGVKVLVVEDNPINALLTKVILRQWEVDCEFAENGKIALDMVQLKEYDLVFMDLQMPVMDGYESTRQIRKLPDEKYKLLPIVALTASVLEDSRERALLAGLDDFLMKPVSHSDMFNSLKKFIDKKESYHQTTLIRSISGRVMSPKVSSNVSSNASNG